VTTTLDGPAWTTHATLTGFVRAIQDGDNDVTPLVCLDWLEEQGATTAGLVKWYAGEPPRWLHSCYGEEEARKRVLAEWLRRHEPKGQTTLQRTHNGIIERKLPARWEWVQRQGIVSRAAADIIGRFRRQVKRNVLAAFGEVMIRRRYVVDERELLVSRDAPGFRAYIRKEMEHRGFRFGRPGMVGLRNAALRSIRESWLPQQTVYTQTLAAPDWIGGAPG